MAAGRLTTVVVALTAGGSASTRFSHRRRSRLRVPAHGAWQATQPAPGHVRPRGGHLHIVASFGELVAHVRDHHDHCWVGALLESTAARRPLRAGAWRVALEAGLLNREATGDVATR